MPWWCDKVNRDFLSSNREGDRLNSYLSPLGAFSQATTCGRGFPQDPTCLDLAACGSTCSQGVKMPGKKWAGLATKVKTRQPATHAADYALLIHALAPPPPADTTWSPVECDQELRGNVIRMQTRPRRPWAEIFFFDPQKQL